ncbi:MAG: leucine-rich repeat domain-containing protein [Clostridiales bacterium]|nr:leucine-rich repeat domain-containing protein [Clostridiales bacterium]
MVQLTKGEVYQIAVTASANTNATLLVSQSDYVYALSTYSAELTYSGYEYTDDVYNSETGTYEEVTKVETLDYARTYDYTVGICANISDYDGTETALTIPSTLGGYAVKSINLSGTPTVLAKRITSVSIPEGVETINSYSMGDFYALASVNLPSTLKTIGEDAFNGCHALTGRITIPASVESVGSYAFYDTGIASVEFLGSDTTVGTQAFGYAVVLNEATVDSTDTTTGKTDGFFVVAPTGSYAEQYAVNKGFTSYDRANCNAGNHPYTVTKVATTLFAKGSTTSVCPVCGNTTKKTIKKKTFKIKSLKSTKKNTLTVKVAKKSSVTGYQIQYSTSKKFTKKTTTTVKVTSKKVNKTIKGLTGGKKHYVRVRAYKTTNGKTVYSKYTATKSVKVKK